MAHIVVMGAGVVGVANGQGFADLGHSVTLVDNDPSRVQHLCAQGYAATTALDLRGPASVVLVTLPTPSGTEGYDLTPLRSGLETLGRALADATERHTVVVRSTVPPHTCDEVVVPTLEAASGMAAGRDFLVAYAPEFLRTASALEDVRSPWMTVVASRHHESLAGLGALFAPFGGELRIFDDPVVAEVIKVAHNAFNATKISFWNEIWQLCQKLDIDADQVATTVALSAEGSIDPNYGIRGGSPFGGECLPKDLDGLLGVGRAVGVDLPLMKSVRLVNQIIADLAHVRSYDRPARQAPFATRRLTS
jgi:UDPglucose 6-dehydrogenase